MFQFSDKPKLPRIQKYLSEQGIASRKKAEEWMLAGYVQLNGRTVRDLGRRMDPGKDKITLDPRAKATERYHYYFFNKPPGIVTVNAQHDEKEIKDLVDLPKGVVPVGRLDKDSSGLILLTDDGRVYRRLTEPKYDHEKEYEVGFFDGITDEALNQLSQGMELFGQRTKPIRITRLNGHLVRMVLTEGKNRQIRRLCEKVGHPVKSLKRVRVLDFQLNGLKPGELQELKAAEIAHLMGKLGLSR